MHLVADVHDTPVSRLSRTPGLWRGFTHLFPFQRSVSGFPRLVSPTAVHFLADVHDTPISKPSPGTDWTVHLVPFHAFASLAPERSLRVPPTAVQARAAGQDTPARPSWVSAVFRLASTSRAGTRPAAAGAPGTAAAAGATPSRLAAASPAAAGTSRPSQRRGARNGDLIETNVDSLTAAGVTSR